MPRETVRGADYHFKAMPEGHQAHRGQSPFPPDTRLGVLEVAWQKRPHGCVEVVTSDDVMLAALIAEVEQVGGSDEVVKAIRSFFHGGSGFWVVLDRDGVNAAITKLRKGRDQAFGRDE